MNAGDLAANILDTIRRRNEKDVRDRVWSLMRKHYYLIMQRQSWALARKSIDLDFSDADSDDKLWLPSNLVGIDRVRDEDGVDYYERDRHDIEPSEGGLRYTVWRAAESPLFSGTGSINSEAASFTCDSLTDDHTGYYVSFGSDECFLLTAIKSFSPSYYGPTKSTDCPVVIRPVRTLAMKLYDDEEEAITDAVITLHYWALPPQLWRDQDDILLPDTQWLELLIYRDMPEAKERRPVNQREIETAELRCMSMNPSFNRSRHPRDRINRPAGLTAGIFDRRR